MSRALASRYAGYYRLNPKNNKRACDRRTAQALARIILRASAKSPCLSPYPTDLPWPQDQWDQHGVEIVTQESFSQAPRAFITSCGHTDLPPRIHFSCGPIVSSQPP